MNRLLLGLCLLLSAICFSLPASAMDTLALAAANPESKTDLGPAKGKTNAILAGVRGTQVPFVEMAPGAEQKVFSARIEGGTVIVREGEIGYLMSGKAEGKGWMFRERLVGSPGASPEGLIRSETKVSLFQGNRQEDWKSNLSAYREVGFPEIAKGIELRIRATGGSIEKLFTVHPGGNPADILLRLEGLTAGRVNQADELEIETGIGIFRMTRPVAYQEIEGKRLEVAAAYRIGDSKPGGLQYGFSIGEYNEKYPLVIDPLLASTCIGGDAWEEEIRVAIDNSGNIFISGHVQNFSLPKLPYPTTPGAYQTTPKGNKDIFVSKFSKDLTTLLASTYLGGNSLDEAYALKVDGSGNIYVAGRTLSSDFPTTPNAYLRTYYSHDGFISKLNNDLSQLLASTYYKPEDKWVYGANGFLALSIDSYGNVYAGGYSMGGGSLPTGGFKIKSTSTDGMIVKMDSNLSTLLEATFLGGDKTVDNVYDIKLDNAGNLFVIGDAGSYVENNIRKSDFPVTSGAYDTQYDSCVATYIAKLDSSLGGLLASTFLETKTGINCGYSSAFGSTYLRAITTDKDGFVYVTGGSDYDFPTTAGAYAPKHSKPNGRGWEPIVVKLDNQLTKILSATFISGTTGNDTPQAIALDPKGNIVIAGVTTSTNYPTTPDADDSTFNGVSDVFISKLNPTLTNLIYSTYLGGSSNEVGLAGTVRSVDLAIDPTGDIIVAGATMSGDFPTTDGAYSKICGDWSYANVFVSRMNIPKKLSAEIISPTNVEPGQEFNVLVRYKNGLETAADNAVIVLDIPTVFSFVSGSNGATLRTDLNRQQVFWKFAKLDTDFNGVVSAKIRVPWGTPTLTDLNLMADIAARNYPNVNVELDSYLNYSPMESIQRSLTAEEIGQFLAANPRTDALLNYLKANGFYFSNTGDSGLQLTYRNGSSVTALTLIDTVNSEVAVLYSADGQAVCEQVVKGTTYKLFDESGGFSVNLADGSMTEWGMWKNGYSSVSNLVIESALDLMQGPSRARAITNCIIVKIPDWLLKSMSTAYSTAKSTLNLPKCIAALAAGEGVPEECLKVKLAWVEGAKELTPWKWSGMMLDVLKCVREGLADPSKFVCTRDITECNAGVAGFLWSSVVGKDTICTSLCTLGFLALTPTCVRCDLASGENYCDTDPTTGMAKCTDKKPDATKEITCNGPHDPNAKSVAPAGDVIPGQTLNYTIQYENVGTGTAFEVFILDVLDINLDSASLAVNNNGEFISDSRLLSWNVGTLPPCTAAAPNVCKGSVSFSVKVKQNVASGTEIVNFAVVHFPSGLEVTPTNPVVNTVRAITADPKSAETLSGKAVAITLTGKDAGSSSLTYRVSTDSLYGVLSGNPPQVTYTSMAQFSGVDSFYYVSNNGVVDSEPARVTIKVNPDPDDKTLPTVVSTFPEADALNVGIVMAPVSSDPAQYLPRVMATFSEPINTATLTPSNFNIGGISGSITYDEVTRTATLTPSQPLLEEKNYTVTLTAGIKDSVGNAMAANYSWRFTTGKEGENCTFTLLPAAINIASTGGNASTVITASGGACDWAATNNLSWVTLNPPSNGTGNGTLSFSVQVNSGEARTGTIAVAGNTLPINQNAADSFSGSIFLPLILR
jgi:hypothetical protein